MPTDFTPMPKPGPLTAVPQEPEPPLLTIEQRRRVDLAGEARKILQATMPMVTSAVEPEQVILLAEWLEGTEVWAEQRREQALRDLGIEPDRPQVSAVWVTRDGRVLFDDDDPATVLADLDRMHQPHDDGGCDACGTTWPCVTSRRIHASDGPDPDREHDERQS